MNIIMPIEIVKEFFPDLSDDEALNILLNRTGYPIFFETDNHEKEIRESLGRFKAILDAGETPCDTCNKVAVIVRKHNASCKPCFRFGGGQNFLLHRLITLLTRRKKRV